jgi:hypothetical protein
MTNLGLRNNWTVALFFALIMMLALPVISFAQGRGHGNGRGRGADKSWKCDKFVNCHDARDGRVDGRGPRSSRSIWDDNDYWRRTRRVDRRDRDGDGDFDRNDVLLGRGDRVDRDGDGDFDRRDVELGRRARRVDRDGDGDFDRRDEELGRRQNRRYSRVYPY